MPNRIIRDSALSSKKLASVSAEAERLFWRLLMVADDFGRFDSDPTVVLAKCFPRLVHKITDKTLRKWHEELLSVGAVVEYSVNGDKIGQFVVWKQRSRAESSKFPPPDDGHMTVIRRSDDRLDEDEDVNRRRESKTGQPPDGFEAFWQAYPRKVKKPDALKAWKQIAAIRPSLETLLSTIAEQKNSHQWLKDAGEFIPYPASWLRGHRWDDQPPEDDGEELPPIWEPGEWERLTKDRKDPQAT